MNNQDPIFPPEPHPHAHEFDPGYTGMSEACNRLVLRAGYGDDCGLPREHPIHRTSWCCATCRADGWECPASCGRPCCGIPPAAPCSTCEHPEGYDRLSGPCPDCHGTGSIPPAGCES